MITTVPADVVTLASIFEADWSRFTPTVSTDRMVLSPGNGRAALLEQILGAESSIRLYAEVIRDDEIIDALSTVAKRGVSVQLLVNEPEDDLDETVYDATLNSNGVEVRHTGSLYIHAKGLIVDEQAVVVGSHNPTAQSLDRNREVSLVIGGAPAVKRGVDVFDRDWLQALPDQFRKGG